MGSASSPENRDEGGLLSCWGHLKLKLPWIRRRIGINNSTNNRHRSASCSNIATAFLRSKKSSKPAGGFEYDPLSYAQNFDEGCWDDDNEDTIHRGFSSRFAPISSISQRDEVMSLNRLLTRNG